VTLEEARVQLAAWLVEEPGRYYERSFYADGRVVRIELHDAYDLGVVFMSGAFADEPSAILSALERAKGLK